MKRLISQEEVLDKKDQGEIFVDDNTIITAAAVDLCKELGIKITKGQDLKSSDKKEEKKGVKENRKKESALSEDEIYNILKEGLNKGLLNESDLERMLD